MKTSPRKYLTKSIFKIGLECPRKLYYHKKTDEYFDDTTEDSFLQALADGGYQVGALAKLKYPEGTEITTFDHEEAIKQTDELLKQKNVVIFEAAFRYKDFFVRCDIVVKNGNSLRIIEVKSKSIDSQTFREDVLTSRPKSPPGKIRIKSSWVPYIYDIAFQTWVARKAHGELSISSFLMALDKNAVNEEPNLHSMFLIRKKSRGSEIILTRTPTPNFKGFRILTEQDVTTYVNDIIQGNELTEHPILGTLEEKAQKIADIYLKNQKYPANKAVSADCKSCQFRGNEAGLKSGFDECWTEAQNIKSASSQLMSFDLWMNRSGQKHVENGIYLLSDLHPEDLTGETTKTRQQIIIDKYTNKDRSPWFNFTELAIEMEQWEWPWHFIDFETCRPAIPFQEGYAPYSQLAFQFSHHVMDKNGRIEHRGEFIDLTPGQNPTFAFMRALKDNLDKDKGSILIYSKHENTVLNDIAKQLENSEEPDRKELIAFIRTITTNSATKEKGPRVMVDLLDVLKNCYYSPLMGNSNSIKYVLPAILSESLYLQQRYSKPIYGSKEMNSKNFQNKVWLENGANLLQCLNPYKELEPIFDPTEKVFTERLITEEQNGIQDGGAAMIAYCKAQFTEMSEIERNQIRAALLRYCELDTLAMVMLVEYWLDILNQVKSGKMVV